MRALSWLFVSLGFATLAPAAALKALHTAHTIEGWLALVGFALLFLGGVARTLAEPLHPGPLYLTSDPEA